MSNTKTPIQRHQISHSACSISGRVFGKYLFSYDLAFEFSYVTFPFDKDARYFIVRGIREKNMLRSRRKPCLFIVSAVAMPILT